MSDYQTEYVGNEPAPQAQVVEQGAEQAQQPQVNPGAIRKSTTQSILKAAQTVTGESFDSVETMMAYLAKVSVGAAQQTNVGSAQPPMEEPQGRIKTTDLHDQFLALKQDLARKEQALREKELESDIRMSMGDQFDPDLMDYAITKVKGQIQWQDDGTYAITNNKGQIRFNTYGDPMGIKDLVDEVAQGNPKLLKRNSAQGGSGLRPAGSFAGAPDDMIPDYTRDPAAFNAWASRNGIGKGVGLKGVTASVFNSSQSKKVF